MTTVTLHVEDDRLLENATKALSGTRMTLDELFSRALRDLTEREKASRDFEEMTADFRAKGYRFPILSREERNARE